MEGGREYAKEEKSQELTEGYSQSAAKGFGFLRYRPVPLKGQRRTFILPSALEILDGQQIMIITRAKLLIKEIYQQAVCYVTLDLAL